MENISKDLILHLADFSRIAITDDEAEKLTSDLKSILEHSEILNELDTSNVEPMTHVHDVVNVMRKDEPKEWITQEEALKNAPDHGDGMFRVPSILSE